MPDGQTHTGINLAVLAGMGAAYTTLHAAAGTDWWPFAAGYLIGTLLITPDLDFGARVRVTARRNWGVLEVIWFPLGLLVKHRGITHTYFRGSTLLLAYAVVTLGALVFLTSLILHELSLPFVAVPMPTMPQLCTAWTGYILAYGLHLWLDGYRPWLTRNW